MWLKAGEKEHKLIRNKKGISQVLMKSRGSVGKFFENLHWSKQENLEEMDKFPDVCVRPKL
jgi:hypothetical protein